MELDENFFALTVGGRLTKLVDERWPKKWGSRRIAADEIGMSYGQLSKALNGKHEPTDAVVGKIIAPFGLSVNRVRGLSVPVVGIVSAGGGIDDCSPPLDEVLIGMLFPPSSVAYLVKGNSMRDVYICPEDYAIVRKNPSPSNGEIVVVYVPDCDGTVVKLKRDKGYDSANERDPHDLIPWTPSCKEYGVLIGVIRQVKQPKRTKGKSK